MKTCRYCFDSQRVVKAAGTPGIHACGSRNRVSQRQSSSTIQLATVKAKLPRSCLRACVKTTRILERWPRRVTDDEIFVSLNEYCKYTEQRTRRPLTTPHRRLSEPRWFQVLNSIQQREETCLYAERIAEKWVVREPSKRSYANLVQMTISTCTFTTSIRASIPSTVTRSGRQIRTLRTVALL